MLTEETYSIVEADERREWGMNRAYASVRVVHVGSMRYRGIDSQREV